MSLIYLFSGRREALVKSTEKARSDRPVEKPSFSVEAWKPAHSSKDCIPMSSNFPWKYRHVQFIFISNKRTADGD
jgi:hypothetical protein